MKVLKSFAVAIFSYMALSGSAFGWGGQGHRIVGDVATSLLTPKARAEIRKLVGSDDLSLISTWADETKDPRTAKWHYINLPVCGSRDSQQNECPGGNCIVTQLRSELSVLKDPAASDPTKAEALKYFVHFMGDVHQPLHVVDNGDAGGNAVQASFTGASGKQITRKLHEIWDTELVKMNLRGVQEEGFASELVAAYSSKAPQLAQGSLDDWIAETRSVSKNFAYKFDGFACGRASSQSVTLSSDYMANGKEVVSRQLAAAGIRLAALLNGAFK